MKLSSYYNTTFAIEKNILAIPNNNEYFKSNKLIIIYNAEKS